MAIAQGAHLVGGVAAPTAEDAMRQTIAILGRHLTRLTDGETGARSQWIWWQIDKMQALPGIRVGEPQYHWNCTTMRDHQVSKSFQLGPLQFRSLKPKVNLLRESSRSVFKRQDLHRENLGTIFVQTHFARNQNRRVNHKQFTVLVVALIHAEQLYTAGQILDRHHGIGFARLLRNSLLYSTHESPNANHLLSWKACQLSNRLCRKLLQKLCKRFQRMPAHINAQKLFLGHKLFRNRPFRKIDTPISLDRQR